MKKLDWPALLRLGVRGLGLRPDEFWRLTPSELQMMLGEKTQGGPMSRAGLDALMSSYPDHAGKEAVDDR